MNLIRCLGLAGIPTVVATPDPEEPALASRHCTEAVLLPSFDRADAAVAALERLGERLLAEKGAPAALLYGSDDALDLVYPHRERLSRVYRLLLNDPGVAEALLEKDRFQSFAEARGLPVPRSIAWEALASHEGPVVVKPSAKSDWHASTLKKQVFGDAKALVFDSGALAAAHEGVAAHRGELTCQEYVRGDDTCVWSYHAVADEAGAVLDSFIGRKIRTHPPGAGESAFIEMARDEELREMAARIAAQVPLKGVFKMDFKRDARSGRWYLLEINARCNLWHYLGAANGVNLPAVACEYMTRGTRPAVPSRYRTARRWLSLELDAKAFLQLRREGSLGLGAWLSSILFSRNIYNVFAWRDPGPWLRFWRLRITRTAARGTERIASAVRQWRSTAS
ncbi:MAG TPA: ATP-grasp domain-containing protein [Usitatibacter sp.]|nr:ATP-grasp domain-containing protein [Usitatibacter sp.]